jgi:hypothetical protein
MSEVLIPEVLSTNASLERSQTETRASLARQNPRDLAVVLKNVLAEIELDTDNAASLVYAIPRKKGGETIYIKGLTIRAAEAVVRYLPNHYLGAVFMPDTEEGVDVIGRFADYEINRHLECPVRVHKVEKLADGRIQTVPMDRFFQNLQSAASKAKRNALFQAVPVLFRQRIMETAERIASGAKKGAKPAEYKPPVDAVLKEFAAFGIDRAALEAMIGKPLEKATPDDIASLRGVKTALKEGLVRPEQVANPETEGVPAPALEQPPAPMPSARVVSQEPVRDVPRHEAAKVLEEVRSRAAANAAPPVDDSDSAAAFDGPEPEPAKPAAPAPAPVTDYDMLFNDLRNVNTTAEHASWPARVSKRLIALSAPQRQTILAAWGDRLKSIKKLEREKASK